MPEKPSEKPLDNTKAAEKTPLNKPEEEKGGFKDMGLLEPTRYGAHDWDVKGRCSDF